MVATAERDRTSTQPLDVLADVLSQASRAGADAADAVLVGRRGLSVAFRLGRRESVERSEASVVGVRVFVGRRQAIVSSSDVSPDAIAEVVGRAVSMARAVPEDPHCGLAGPDEIGAADDDLDLCDPVDVGAETLAERAAAAESAALAVDGVTNSEGAEAGWGVDAYAIAASNGLAHTYARSWHSLSVSVLAGQGTQMERDYDYATAVHAAELDAPEAIGRRAGERAVRRLGPRKAASTIAPVIYEPRVARSLLGHLAMAINGSSVARGTTFLRDKLDEAILPAGLDVIDDPLRRRGLRSRPFDAEGIGSVRRTFVENGVLRSWVLDLRSARQLGLKSTGHAARGASSPPSPSPTNLALQGGRQSPRALMSAAGSGLYVTDLMGFGVNGVTGDYSRGASGFWIENGEVAYPVSEITVSGNLLEMFRRLVAADDLEFRYGTDAPTLLVEGMTIAGR